MSLTVGDFDGLLAPFARDEFLARFWGRQFGHFPGDAGRFAPLFSWSELDGVLQAQAFDLSQFKLFQDGKPVDAKRYLLEGHGVQWIQPASLVDLLAAGATLILDSVHAHAPAVRALARSVERHLFADTVVNVYAAWRTQKGFDLHWDRQDTFILQVAGNKRWQVFEPTRLHPLGDDLQKPPQPACAPVWDKTLHQGEMLYLPRGWWHAAIPLDEPSLHLTVTVVPAAGTDLMAWLGERLKQHPQVRMNVPMVAPLAERAEYLRTIRRLIDEELAGEALEEFIGQWADGLAPGGTFGLPHRPARPASTIGPDSRARLASNRRLRVTAAGDGHVVFHANGTRWTCPGAFAAALASLNPHEAVSVRALSSLLAGGADAGQFMTFLAGLQMGGVLWVDDDA